MSGEMVSIGCSCPQTEAVFSSRCKGCETTIFEGDPIFKVDGEWCCDDCHDDYHVGDE